jgi:hypothetical protein
MKDKQVLSEVLPPYPKRFEVVWVLFSVGGAMAFLGAVERWWGIESRVPEPLSIGTMLTLVLSLYNWRYTSPPFGPYAPRSIRRKLRLGVLNVFVFAGIVAGGLQW